MVLAQGLAFQFEIGIGLSIIVVSFGVLFFWIPLKEKPGIGTFINFFVVAAVIEMTLPYIPYQTDTSLKLLQIFLGILVIGFGGSIYLIANLGPGPRDGGGDPRRLQPRRPPPAVLPRLRGRPAQLLRPQAVRAARRLPRPARHPRPGQEKGAKFPTSKAHISVVFHSFWLIFGRVIISRNGLERERLSLERARAERPR